MISMILHITLSKILAFLVLFIGTLYSYMFNDSAVLISTFGAASTIMGIKTFTESKERQTQMVHPEPSDGPEI